MIEWEGMGILLYLKIPICFVMLNNFAMSCYLSGLYTVSAINLLLIVPVTDGCVGIVRKGHVSSFQSSS